MIFVPVIFLSVVALWGFALVFWVVKIVEVAGIPDHQFKAANTEKLTWILIVVLAGIIGALVWQFAKRDEVVARSETVPPPRPGWYAEPGNNGLRWWDGTRWTEHRHVGPPTS